VTDGHHLTVHHLRITLLDVSPPVWRLLRVPSAVPLTVLHSILQAAMGWEDRHLHEWRVDDAYFGSEADDGEAAVILGEVAPVDSVLHYDYDLSDGWEHLVEVVAVLPYDGSVPPLAVLDGARAAPPEDCGGPAGYEHLLDALADPADLEHEEMVQAFGDSLDPAFFDPALVNRRLEPLWRPSL
jgi:hypothetical protein